MRGICREETVLCGRTVTLYSMPADLLEDEEVFAGCLRRMPEGRREKVMRYRFEPDRRLSLAAGLLLEEGLSERGIDYAKAAIGTEDKGRPYLKDRDDVLFSLAHSGNRALAAFSDARVGCDTELIKPERDLWKLADRFYSPAEALEVKGDPESFYRLWTLKESCLKAMGTGLSRELSSVSFEKDGGLYRCGECVLIYRKKGDYAEAVCVEARAG
ncbi:MAG: 4'-phosphopantetheinyl transferase superfamily protein [Lachnospiraceae bacterium]|nr:4'-phosphopantetheinyl transferase superfamily protein [Lachnospiraceae bacterium]